MSNPFRKRPRRHPTPTEAVGALKAGRCLYAPLGACSSEPISVGLRGDDDINAVLVCRAHFGRLRRIDARSLGQLERVLREAFLRLPPPAPARDEGPQVVLVKSHT